MLRGKRLLGDMQAARRLLASGTFDAQSYRRFNRDLDGSDFRLALHYVRHGRWEERRFLRDGLADWLVLPVISGRVDPSDVSRLRAALGSGVDIDNRSIIDAFCRSTGLDGRDYLFHDAFGKGDFARAAGLIPELDPEAHFWAAHRMAVRLGVTSFLPQAFETGFRQLENGQFTGHTPKLTALADMAEAIGADGPAFNALLLDAAQTSRNQTDLRARLWRMRLPILLGPGAIGEQLRSQLSGHLCEALASDDEPLPPIARDCLSLFDAAAANNLGLGPHNLVQVDGTWSEAPSGQPTVLLRLPHATHWLLAEQQEMSLSFLQAFKRLIALVLDLGFAVRPISAGRIHNVTDVAPTDLPIVSYHGFLEAPRPALFMKESALPGIFHVNPTGYCGWALSLKRSIQAPEAARRTHEELVETFSGGQRSKYAQETGIAAPGGDYIFFALQVTEDSVAQHASLRRAEILYCLLEHYAGSGTTVVVKKHPMDSRLETDRLLESFSKKYNHLQVSRAPIHALVSGARCVVTINSGVGIEALLQLKPVITTGRSEYGEATLVAHDMDQLKAALRQVDQHGDACISKDRIIGFLHELFAHNCFTLLGTPQTVIDMARESLMRDVHKPVDSARPIRPDRASG